MRTSRQLAAHAKSGGFTPGRRGALAGQQLRPHRRRGARSTRALGLAEIPPELREGRGEIEAARGRDLAPPARASRPAGLPPLPHHLLGRLQQRGGAGPRLPRCGIRVDGHHRPQQGRGLCRRVSSTDDLLRQADEIDAVNARRDGHPGAQGRSRPTSWRTAPSTTTMPCSRGSTSSSARSTAASAWAARR